jgi:ubiquinone/menaquinone biosynthesis C-methylase UbiE
MRDLKTIQQVVTDYWTLRAQTYSDDMTAIDMRQAWKEDLQRRVESCWPEKKPEEIKVLELATGHGYFASIFAELGYTVTAVDMAPGMLQVAKRNGAAVVERFDFHEMNAEELTFPDNSFDVVFCRYLTWLLPRPELAYSEWCRVLKPGGLLLVFDTMQKKDYKPEDAVPSSANKDNPYRAKLMERTGMSQKLYDDLIDISNEFEIDYHDRPAWDVQVLSRLGMDASSENATYLSALGRGKKDDEGKEVEPSPLMLVKGFKK